MAKLDGANGTRLWGWQGGSAGNDYANAVALDPAGDVYACGSAPQGMFSDLESAPDGEREDGAREGEMEGADWDHDDMSAARGYGQAVGGDGAVADMFVAKVGVLWRVCGVVLVGVEEVGWEERCVVFSMNFGG